MEPFIVNPMEFRKWADSFCNSPIGDEKFTGPTKAAAQTAYTRLKIDMWPYGVDDLTPNNNIYTT